MSKQSMSYQQAINLLVKIAQKEFHRLAPQANMYMLHKGSIGNGAGKSEYELRAKILEAIRVVSGQEKMDL